MKNRAILVLIIIVLLFLMLSVSCNNQEYLTADSSASSTSTPELLIVETAQQAIPSSTPINVNPTPTTTPVDTLVDQESYLLISLDRSIFLNNPHKPDENINISSWIDEDFQYADLHKFSPDGNKLIISRMQGWDPSKRRIYILDLRTFNIKQLLQESAAQSHAEWGPDGERIALTLFYENESKNYVVNVDGSGLQELPSVEKWNLWPKWSPDGKKIYFMSQNDYGLFTFSTADIYEVDSNGDNLRKVNNKAYGFQSFNLSPDGSMIAFTAPTMGEDIYVMNVDGGGVANITNSSSRETSIVWAPDSKEIAFQTDRDGNWELYTVNIDGSNPVRLTNQNEHDGPILWSPNGDYIAFYSARSGDPQIYTVMMDDYSIQQITNANSYPHLADLWINRDNTEFSIIDIINMFRIGATLRITSEGDNLNVRSLPDTESEILVFLKPGDIVHLLDGPRNSSGYLWWKVSAGGQNIVGWVAENVGWFEPIGQ